MTRAILRSPLVRMMGRRARLGSLALVASLGFTGCPLPQPLPESVAVNGGNFTPPRILADSVTPNETVVLVGTTSATAPAGTDPDCPDGTDLTLAAQLEDDNTEETVDVRWFVDYRPDATGSHIQQSSSIPAPVSGTRRSVPEFHFSPDALAGTTHVVELVVSNGFYPIGEEPAGVALPGRTPRPKYETQVYRWIFQTAAKGRCH